MTVLGGRSSSGNLSGCRPTRGPLTNPLPIRRIRLVLGEPQELKMAWLPLDGAEPVDGQVYTLLDDRHYCYQAVDGSFEALSNWMPRDL